MHCMHCMYCRHMYVYNNEARQVAAIHSDKYKLGCIEHLGRVELVGGAGGWGWWCMETGVCRTQ